MPVPFYYGIKKTVKIKDDSGTQDNDTDKYESISSDGFSRNVESDITYKILKMYNSLVAVENQYVRRGFQVERILGFSRKFETDTTSFQKLVKNLKAFDLKIDPIRGDGDCLFRSVLIQMYKLECDEEPFMQLRQHLQKLGLYNVDIEEGIHILR